MYRFVFHRTIVCTLLLLCTTSFSSCKEQDVNLQISLSQPIVSGEATEQFLRIETDNDRTWTVTVNPGNDWCFVQPSSGTGSIPAIVATGENGDETERKATITVKTGKTSKSVHLTQQALAALDVVGYTNAPSSASTLQFQIRTKLQWTASITNGGNFCTVTPTSGNGNGTVNVSFNALQTGSRTANLRVSVPDYQIDLTLTQGQSATRPEQNIPNRIELPEVKNKRWYVEHKYYAMEYDTAQRHSVWVAYVFNSYYNQKNVNRSNAWAFDPIIPAQFLSLNSPSQTYQQGYDRGHLIASEDRVFSLDANRETFYFSNMSPQVGPFNQQIWANLENLVRKWAQASDCDTLYVVTGGAINSGIETIGKLENRNNVTIPKYYFKALVKRKGNSFDGIAFWMENKRYDNNRVTHEYSISIRDLERLTGINFFPNLKYAIPGNPGLEDAVETVRDVAKWPL